MYGKGSFPHQALLSSGIGSPLMVAKCDLTKYGVDREGYYRVFSFLVIAVCADPRWFIICWK